MDSACEISDHLNNLNALTLYSMSHHCFELYKNRLGEEKDTNYKLGSVHYEYIHQELINTIVPFKPRNFSFSISSTGPSLHFIARLPDSISIFMETYINVDDEEYNTYLQVLKGNDPILQTGGDFVDCLKTLDAKLEDIFPSDFE